MFIIRLLCSLITPIRIIDTKKICYYQLRFIRGISAIMKKVVKTCLLIVFFFVWFMPAFFAAAASWSDTLYTKYSCREFKSFPPANRTIDFDHIDYPLLNAAIFFATNCARIKYGLAPFDHSVELEKAAFFHSKDMVEDDFFSHDNPYDAQKRSPFERMALVGVVAGHRAENIAIDFGIRYKSGDPVVPPQNGEEVFRDSRTGRVIPVHTYNSLAATLVEGWMHSARHRANILNRNLKYLGSGAFHFRDRAFYGMDTFKATQDFASDVPD
jgi:uncharacterized protein YkwD